MTATKFVWPMFLLIFSTAACEEKTAAPEATEAKPAETAPVAEAPKAEAAPVVAAPAAKEAALPGPADVCTTLCEAAKAKDDSKFLSLSTPATQTVLAADGAKEHILKTLGAATCGAVKLEGESASINLQGTTPAQEATFTKTADGWRFDGAAFLAKYPIKVIKEKGKKAAAKAHQKAAAHQKHHH